MDEPRWHLVDVGRRAIASYREFVPDELMKALVATAARLRGARVLHLNATPYGGGVSELLRSTVPISTIWASSRTGASFVATTGSSRWTKKIHNGLQGAAEGLDDTDREAYSARHGAMPNLLPEDYDFVFLTTRSRPRVARCHRVATDVNLALLYRYVEAKSEVWGFLRGYLQRL